VSPRCLAPDAPTDDVCTTPDTNCQDKKSLLSEAGGGVPIVTRSPDGPLSGKLSDIYLTRSEMRGLRGASEYSSPSILYSQGAGVHIKGPEAIYEARNIHR